MAEAICSNCDWSASLEGWGADEVLAEWLDEHRRHWHPTVDEIRVRWAAAHQGVWAVERESCDCGGGYPCGHGDYPTSIAVPHRDDKPWSVSEIGDIRDVDLAAVEHAALDVAALLAELDRLTAEPLGSDTPPPDDIVMSDGVADIADAIRSVVTSDGKPIGRSRIVEMSDGQRSIVVEDYDWFTAASVLLAEVRRLASEIRQMSGQDHFVTFTDDAWTVEHPAACRAAGPLSECQATVTASRLFVDDPGVRGRWKFDPQAATIERALTEEVTDESG